MGASFYRFLTTMGSLAREAGLSAVLLAGLALASPAPAADVAPTDAMAQRVARAQQFTSENLLAKVRNNSIAFHWIGATDRFWFRKVLDDGDAAFVVVDAATGRQQPLFDKSDMDAALVRAGARAHATILGADLDPTGGLIRVRLAKPDARCSWPEAPGRCSLPTDTYICDLPVSACRLFPDLGAAILSPDWKRVAFVRDHNLWVRDLESGAERQLTTAGVAHFAYGETQNAFDYGHIIRRRAGLPEPLRGLLWSPDGRYILSVRDDLRATPDRTILTEFLPPEGGSPINYTERLAIASDAKYPDSTVEVIEVATGAVRETNVDPQAFAGSIAAYYYAKGMVLWAPDNDSVSIVGIRRGTRDERLIRIDMRTGRARDLIVETAGKMLTTYRNPVTGLTARVLSSGKQAVWFSERDGWGHFYLYDVVTGRVIRQITRGSWTVVDLVRVDEATRTLYFTAVGREKGRNPYYRHFYKVGLDGGQPTLLTPENADHNFGEDAVYTPGSFMGGGMSPSGRYFIDCFSTISQPDEVIIRRADGTRVADVVKADITALLATGWRPPEPFTVKAADGRTDLYGVMFKPIDFDPTKKYPIIEITYPPTGFKFTPTSFWETLKGETTYNAQAFAEMGAIVVGFDGRGGGLRSLAFRDSFLGSDDWMGAVDHVAAIRNLAAEHHYIDIDRVGLTGHSYGGYASLRAMLLYPGFFKVVVSGEGPGQTINNTIEVTTERLFGIPNNPETRAYYGRVSNTSLASRLADKLLLIYAGADEAVAFRNASAIILSLQKADKDFDTLFLPDSPHYGGREPYGMRWTLRYFGENLGGPR